jgi:hypothetical protein
MAISSREQSMNYSARQLSGGPRRPALQGQQGMAQHHRSQLGERVDRLAAGSIVAEGGQTVPFAESCPDQHRTRFLIVAA